jgi:hypothetical protein
LYSFALGNAAAAAEMRAKAAEKVRNCFMVAQSMMVCVKDKEFV